VKLGPYDCVLLLFLPHMAIDFTDGPAGKPNDSTLGAKPPDGAVVLFDGKSLEGWVKRDGKNPADWPVTDGIVTVGRGDIMTQRRFGDFELPLEFNVPYMPKQQGQARGNSGVYLGGLYELQVLDSYGLKLKDNDCGAIYKQVVPAVNACKPPLRWQTYDVTLQKAVVAKGKVVAKARVTVIQNGIKTIDRAEIVRSPGGADVSEGRDGPILLQDHGNAVEYRNIWIKPLTGPPAVGGVFNAISSPPDELQPAASLSALRAGS
jgi:Domain of Unknown Function (DUF1080)